jgi:hypothetical protein
MKKLENKETGLTKEVDGVKSNLGYVDLLLYGLNAQPKEGWTTAQMKERFNVIEKIEKVKLGKTVELEDAEFMVAYNCRIINWSMMHKDIVAFDEYLEKLKM